MPVFLHWVFPVTVDLALRSHAHLRVLVFFTVAVSVLADSVPSTAFLVSL